MKFAAFTTWCTIVNPIDTGTNCSICTPGRPLDLPDANSRIGTKLKQGRWLVIQMAAVRNVDLSGHGIVKKCIATVT